MCGFRPVFALAHGGRLIHSPLERIERHRHEASFMAIVLRGEYIEAGDAGRATLGPGSVAVHGPCEAHINRAGARGAEVLLLPAAVSSPVIGASDAVDAIARLAETDQVAAAELAQASLRQQPVHHTDWPDALACDLGVNPSLSLTDWAREAGLRPETISRGFRRVFGCSPQTFRASVRAQAAWRDVKMSESPLKTIAADHGYADQAHMSRAILALSGRPPREWRSTRTP